MAIEERVIDIDDAQAIALQAGGQLRGADRGDRGSVGEHELDAGIRMPRIQRHIGRPRLEHRQYGDDRLGRALHQQRHIRAGAHAVTGQQMRQPVRCLVEFAVRPRPSGAADRHRLRGPGHLGGEQLRHRHR
ncbi:hypothetical protein MNVI_00120 [Mycobacterium noviomagense]|uniref:Uncharacterized protein n=1 Tax=Mycobacterium noviomagense TaxID=459858 RepID=A0A7I7P7Z3_9MYCO|nr:hypothetical protein MNVI_00120 [Mycobacterium noviomagense]